MIEVLLYLLPLRFMLLRNLRTFVCVLPWVDYQMYYQGFNFFYHLNFSIPCLCSVYSSSSESGVGWIASIHVFAADQAA